jgi:hypothetical protein
VREARHSNRRSGAPAAAGNGAFAAVTRRLWTNAARRPVDSFSILAAGAASLIIVVNAVFLQTGPHPAPFFANPAAALPPADRRAELPVLPAPKVSEKLPEPQPHPAVGAKLPQPVASRRTDPIGDLIGSSVSPSARIAAVQRTLSEFGYGQIKPTGILDEPTIAAIGKFESEHKMPVTGRLSDRLLSELAVMTGRALE